MSSLAYSVSEAMLDGERDIYLIGRRWRSASDELHESVLSLSCSTVDFSLSPLLICVRSNNMGERISST